jgi:hypothetical protein
MTAPATLNSRLRVLIAKTFRAEKLYSSIRHPRGEKLANVSTLAEMANDIRAKEWERCHYQLRVALNDILALGSNSAVLAEILQLRERFYQAAEESNTAVETGTETLLENIRRHEFAHSFRMSLELIRHKARAQASKVVTDELSAVLEASGRNPSAVQQYANNRRTVPTPEKREEEPFAGAEEVAVQTRSNVIPLRRRFVAGGRGGR